MHFATDELLAKLNAQQRIAAQHGVGPLLIVAGAGTGKTTTLVHRLAYLLATRHDPARTVLLTFTRRAAADLIRRADNVLGRHGAKSTAAKTWAGTFHAVAMRLLRIYGRQVGLDPTFTIHDRSDSEDLLNVLRTDLGLTKTDKRFPKKTTCMDIYSRSVNSQSPLEKVLATSFPWCLEFADELKRLFQEYVDRKARIAVLDYDDLLLFWNALLQDAAGERVRARFDCVLVDEYQDTNRLQGEILKGLRPDGHGLSVVGDDAQSIYSFRAATVRNILDFPKEFPGATVVKLEQNYRSTQAILKATNCVISEAAERYAKKLWSERLDGELPRLVTCEDEQEQADFVAGQILEHRESNIDLRRQAVLFRASHHSIMLEAELSRRGIPFVKYGGLRFIETAHVKDVMAFLRLAENRRDVVAGMRILCLLPGIGPTRAELLMRVLQTAGGDFGSWKTLAPPAASDRLLPKLTKLLASLADDKQSVQEQVRRVRKFYAPLLEDKYDNAKARMRDLEQIEQLAARYTDRAVMLAEITLDPPSSSEELAGPPRLDDDFLVLSTIHSAKGLEWDVVFVIHASDGNIPSDMATGDQEQIEEERRLFYVALTRAKSWLYVCCPFRYYYAFGRGDDRFGFAQMSRFLSRKVKARFHPAFVGSADRVAGDKVALRTRLQLKNLWA